MIFIAVYGPTIHEFLSFAAISLIDWIHVFGAALVFLGICEFVKLLKRKKILSPAGPVENKIS
jgi:hypothetical protein